MERGGVQGRPLPMIMPRPAATTIFTMKTVPFSPSTVDIQMVSHETPLWAQQQGRAVVDVVA